MLKIGVIAHVEEESRSDFYRRFADAVFVASDRQISQFSVHLGDWSDPPRGGLPLLPQRYYFADLWIAILPHSVVSRWGDWHGLWAHRPGRVVAVLLGGGTAPAGDPIPGVPVVHLPSPAQSATDLTEDELVRVVAEARRAIPDAFQRVRSIAQTGPIKVATVHNLTVFEGVGLEFVPSINVLIGTNGTGKTHTLKLIYAVLSAGRRLARRSAGRAQARLDELESELKDRLGGLFRMSDGRAVSLVRDSLQGHITIEHQHQLTTAALDDVGVDLASEVIPAASSILFLPSREALAQYEGFVSTYENRELSFDETYYDLCVALGATTLRGPAAREADVLLSELGDVLGGDIELRDGRFVLVQRGSGRLIEAHLMSEGMRKIASLVRLVRNGSIRRDSILFWDEPESSLNPRLAEKVLQFLVRLARHGVQIFLATHDYLIAHKLSLMAERKLEPGVSFRFLSFWRDEAAGPDAPVQVEQGDTLTELQHDAILEEYLAFAAREVAAAAGPETRS